MAEQPLHRRPWLLAVAGGTTALLMTGAYLLVDDRMTGPTTADVETLMAAAQAHVDAQDISKPTLIEQLEFDGYSTSDAEYAAEHVNADWHLEASGVAFDALSYSAYSEAGLVEFLEFRGFSSEEAQFGVNDQTVDWQQQAAILASSYIDVGIESREAMIDQLLYEGFSQSDAEYGATAVGLR